MELDDLVPPELLGWATRYRVPPERLVRLCTQAVHAGGLPGSRPTVASSAIADEVLFALWSSVEHLAKLKLKQWVIARRAEPDKKLDERAYMRARTAATREATSEALGVFEHSDNVALLAERVLAVDYFSTWNTAIPLNTLDELADLFVAFAGHLRANRTYLTVTGHPETSFERSSFLNHHLTNLYYVKLPVGFSKARRQERTSPDPDRRYTYIWGREGGSANGKVLTYDEVAAFDDLEDADVARLESLRSKMLDVKLDVLGCLGDALRERTPDRLWTECLRVLTRVLTAVDFEFLLRMDRYYLGYDIKTGEIDEKASDLVAGGLSSLLQVIGHVEKELGIGTLAATRDALGTFARLDWAARPCLSIGHYLDVSTLEDRSVLDHALDEFRELDRQEQPFWDAFRTRLVEAIGREFDVVVNVRVRAEYAAQLIPAMQTFAEYAALLIPAMQTLADSLRQRTEIDAPTTSEVTAPKPEPPANAFWREKEVWYVRFEGKDARLKHVDGLAYIAILLRQPDVEIGVDKLYAMVNPAPIVEDVSSADDDDGLSAREFETSLEVTDEAALAQYVAEAKKLKEKIEDAEARGSNDKAGRLKIELDGVTDAILEARGAGGRLRKVNPAQEKIRKNLRNRIVGATAKIGETLPALKAHLDRYIVKGRKCIYEPERSTTWLTEPE